VRIWNAPKVQVLGKSFPLNIFKLCALPPSSYRLRHAPADGWQNACANGRVNRRSVGAGIPGDIDASAPLGSHPTKEVRGFDTETIPEETEESEDSLYGVDSTMETESKRHSGISAPERTPTHTPKPV
jgi:hypothetical protein